MQWTFLSPTRMEGVFEYPGEYALGDVLEAMGNLYTVCEISTWYYEHGQVVENFTAEVGAPVPFTHHDAQEQMRHDWPVYPEDIEDSEL